MWVLSGPFDGTEGGDLEFTKLKLIKPGKQYVLGRKDKDLIIRNKKVSREHATFIVGKCSLDDVIDSSSKPSVQIHNQRPLPLEIVRKNDRNQANGGSLTELEEGDIIRPFGSCSIKLEWRPVCCYLENPVDIKLQAYADLGMHAVQDYSSDITHHVASNLSLTPSIALSVLSALPLVTPDWLAEVIRLGRSNEKASSLELQFELPLTKAFRPQMADSLPPSLRLTSSWEPNNHRSHMFSDHGFILFTYKEEQEARSLLDVFSRIGGTSTLFNVAAGKSSFRRLLSKNKAKESWTIVTDDSLKRKVNADQWEEVHEEAHSSGLPIISRQQVLEAVVKIDLSIISYSLTKMQAQSRSPSVLPDIIPNSMPEEPSIPSGAEVAKAKKIVRRASPSVTQASSSLQEMEESAPLPRRRNLTRRAGIGLKPFSSSVDDSTTLDSESIVPIVEQSMLPPSSNKPVLGVDFSAPVIPRSTKLKRRAGTAGVPSLTQATPGSSDLQGNEPPLRKFKALFEESDPDRMSQLGSGTHVDAGESSTDFQSVQLIETQVRPGQSRLHVVEEEEEPAPSANADHDTHAVKRKAADVEDREDIEMESQPDRTSKRRAIEDPTATSPQAKSKTVSPSSQKQTKKVPSGSQFGKPDTDDNFLKAIASMKKGKKTEDTFDREFNNLRISKPDLQKDDREKEWAVLADFGDESNVRGNFMVVVEMTVHNKNGAAPVHARRGVGRPEWDGKPDFKKFRKNHVYEPRPPIELLVSEENDYGMGPAYWKDSAQTRSQQPDERSAPGDSSFSDKRQTQGKHRTLTVPMEDSDENEYESHVRRRPVKQAIPAAPSQKPKRKPVDSRAEEEVSSFEPLFMESDDDKMDDDDDVEIDELDDETPTLGSTRSSKTQKSLKRKTPPAAIVIEDDSDDGATFRGFGANSKKTRTRR